MYHKTWMPPLGITWWWLFSESTARFLLGSYQL